MKNKVLHSVLTVFLLFAMVFTVASKIDFGTTDTEHKIEKTSDNDQQEFVSSQIEATFPASVFKLSAALVFVFEVITSIENVQLPYVELCSLQTTSYWVKLITSTIVVNAP